jgi:hypothetical protein
VVQVYAPEGTPEVRALSLTPMPAAGSALRIGTLQNNKHNAGLLLTTVAGTLAGRLGTRDPLNTEKERASLPAPDGVINRLVAEADFVLVGTAD